MNIQKPPKEIIEMQADWTEHNKYLMRTVEHKEDAAMNIVDRFKVPDEIRKERLDNVFLM